MIIKLPYHWNFNRAKKEAIFEASKKSNRFRLIFLYIEHNVDKFSTNYIFKMDDLNDPWAENKD